MGVIALLSREGCEAKAVGARTEAARALTAGWHVRHWLPVRHPFAPGIAAQLRARGPLVGAKEEIYLVGSNEPMAQGLRAAGWTVWPAEVGAEPRIEVFAPDETLRWSGVFRGDELGTRGAVVLDTVVLEKVARGEAVAPYVPVGCVTPLGGDERVAVSGSGTKFSKL